MFALGLRPNKRSGAGKRAEFAFDQHTAQHRAVLQSSQQSCHWQADGGEPWCYHGGLRSSRKNTGTCFLHAGEEKEEKPFISNLVLPFLIDFVGQTKH